MTAVEDSFIGNGSYKEDQSISRQVFVIKRNKSRERFQPEKIRASVQKHSVGLGDVDQQLMMDELDTKLYDGISTKEIDDLLIRLAALKIASEPQYGQLAARLLHTSILKEASLEGSTSFSEGVRLCHAQGLLSDTVNDAVQANADRLNDEIDHGRTATTRWLPSSTLQAAPLGATCPKMNG
jgi:ribonucleoside-diphosphate reductase alpha chain